MKLKDEVNRMENLNNNFEFAYWYYDPNANDWGLGGWRCSNCDFKNDVLGMSEHLNFPINMIAGTRYCANCGRKMRTKREDET